ncbi:MAG: hypothetical protein Q4D21_09715 [Phascolarctobacterium sp.]|nr:hypothetical protein [Phascolarctobacterium sp.]
MEIFSECKTTLKKVCGVGLALIGIGQVAAAQEKIVIPEDFSDFQEVTYDFKAVGPTLIFSDSPEFVYKNGVLYRDDVQGKLRIFFHHLNAVKGTTKKLAVVLKNKSSLKPVNYTITRQGMGGKTHDWLLDGKVAEENYFTKEQKIVNGKLGFGRSIELISGKGILLKFNQLWTGIVDFELDSKAELSVLMCDARSDIDLFNENAVILPMDEHPLRGTFNNADWVYDIKDNIQGETTRMIKLAGAEDGEGYIKGVDKTTGLPAENYGNYGVMYEMNFTIGGKQQMNFVMNPIGGPFNGWGVLETNGKKKFIGMPEDAVNTANNVEDARILAKLAPGKYKFTWSPAGTASLPLRFFWMPYSRQKEIKNINKKYFKSYKASVNDEE